MQQRRSQITIFDLIAMLVPLQLAGVGAVWAFQARGWPGALLAPIGVLFLFILGGQLVRLLADRRRPSS
ncbi:MAG: hypothetical protein KAI24_00980 [Planctomycetes bacterium]|nr:hypothetical protein [Planctomycetota bacterium]